MSAEKGLLGRNWRVWRDLSLQTDSLLLNSSNKEDSFGVEVQNGLLLEDVERQNQYALCTLKSASDLNCESLMGPLFEIPLSNGIVYKGKSSNPHLNLLSSLLTTFAHSNVSVLVSLFLDPVSTLHFDSVVILLVCSSKSQATH